MKKKIEKNDPEFKLFQEFWRIRQDYYNAKTDEEVKQMNEEISKITKLYEGTKIEWFSRQLLLLHAEDCERRMKNV